LILRVNLTNKILLLAIGLSFVALTGCATAVTAVGVVASGLAYGTEYVLTSQVSRTTTHEFVQVKKALLVALCRMQISVQEINEIEDGERILANADDLKIKIELKKITPRVTRIKVRAANGLSRDKATASEIVQQTEEIAQTPAIQKTSAIKVTLCPV
jgi:hypothetical protein